MLMPDELVYGRYVKIHLRQDFELAFEPCRNKLISKMNSLYVCASLAIHGYTPRYKIC